MFILRLFRHFIALLCSMLLFGSVFADDAVSQQTLTTRDGDDFVFEVFTDAKHKPKLRVLWIAPGFGINPRHREASAKLAKLGAEVWLIDLADALFLPKGAVSMREISSVTVAQIISALGAKDTNTNLLVVTSSYGAIPSLRGIHAWQQQQNKQGKLIGAVFFSPSFFTHVPELGVAPTFIDELAATNIPLYIFQSGNNGNRWHLSEVLSSLNHATVYTEVLKGVMSVFYHKDKTPASIAAFNNTPNMILRAAQRLAQHSMPDKPLVMKTQMAERDSGINTQLHPYQGEVKPKNFSLNDIDGNTFTINNFTGELTLINFWASWCPPCVEEIPSLNRLMNAMQGKPFQLISINYAESPEKIRAFLNEVDVHFPVLMDLDGKITRHWKVVAFPSTYVIGPDGKIHYGVNAAIHWDTPELIQQLQQLVDSQ